MPETVLMLEQMDDGPFTAQQINTSLLEIHVYITGFDLRSK